jgi:uncharacterized membrane protein YqaE (UPF0057 family)
VQALLANRQSFRSSATAPALLSHRDVVAAIAPGNLAAFPPSLEVNAAYARSGFLPTSCILAVVLTLLTYIPVGNAHPGCRRAGLFQHLYQMKVLNRLVYNDERRSEESIYRTSSFRQTLT